MTRSRLPKPLKPSHPHIHNTAIIIALAICLYNTQTDKPIAALLSAAHDVDLLHVRETFFAFPYSTCRRSAVRLRDWDTGILIYLYRLYWDTLYPICIPLSMVKNTTEHAQIRLKCACANRTTHVERLLLYSSKRPLASQEPRTLSATGHSCIIFSKNSLSFAHHTRFQRL